MIYVMSDIHGMYDKYKKMLNEINFTEEDTLYIIGDVVDRGLQSIEVIEHIRENKNIVYIKGNHELMLEEYFKSRLFDNDEVCESWIENMWFNNGGYRTYLQLKEKGETYIKELYSYIKSLPLYASLSVNNEHYILVHAGLYIPYSQENLSLDELLNMQDEDYILWDRAFVNNSARLNDFTVIVGHTPTINYENNKQSKNYENNKQAKILYLNGKIMIDCGAVFGKYNGVLGCLRLDDFEEFYI